MSDYNIPKAREVREKRLRNFDFTIGDSFKDFEQKFLDTYFSYGPSWSNLVTIKMKVSPLGQLNIYLNQGLLYNYSMRIRNFIEDLGIPIIGFHSEPEYICLQVDLIHRDDSVPNLKIIDIYKERCDRLYNDVMSKLRDIIQSEDQLWEPMKIPDGLVEGFTRIKDELKAKGYQVTMSQSSTLNIEW